MSFINKLERKLGKYAITNLSLYLITCYGFGYIIYSINNEFLTYLTLNPFYILKGQVWRIFTWILVPPGTSNIFFVLIMLYFYYSIGTTLEKTWGAFYYNFYIFSGMIFTVIGSFVLMGVYFLQYGGQFDSVGQWMIVMRNLTQINFVQFNTYYVNMSIFLAFAATFPEMQILFMFVIPIKVKVLGIIYSGFLIFEAFNGKLIAWIVIGSSLLNFIVFFFWTRKKMIRSPKQIRRQHVYQKEIKRAAAVTRHKCAICGRTEEEFPELEFRFCSKCEGSYEYCQDHLFTHEHIRKH